MWCRGRLVVVDCLPQTLTKTWEAGEDRVPMCLFAGRCSAWCATISMQAQRKCCKVPVLIQPVKRVTGSRAGPTETRYGTGLTRAL